MIEPRLPNLMSFMQSSIHNKLQETPDLHGFVIMGKKDLFLCHLPMFYAINHQYQLILQAELGSEDKSIYIKTRNENPDNVIIIGNHNPMLLKDVANSKSFLAEGYIGMPNSNSQPFFNPEVIVKEITLFEHINPLGDVEYPEHYTYYLYGKNLDFHISHLISRFPNFQHEIDVTLSQNLYDMMTNTKSKVTKITFPALFEKDNQPIEKNPLKNLKYDIEWDNHNTGSIKIEKYAWFDSEMLNMK